MKKKKIIITVRIFYFFVFFEVPVTTTLTVCSISNLQQNARSLKIRVDASEGGLHEPQHPWKFSPAQRSSLSPPL